MIGNQQGVNDEYLRLGRGLALECLSQLRAAVSKETDKHRTSDPQYDARLIDNPYFRDRQNEIERIERNTLTKIKLNLGDLADDKNLRADEFRCLKTFVDAASEPMQHSIAVLYAHSSSSCLAAQLCTAAIQTLDEWRKNFVRLAQDQVNALLDEFRSQLADRAESFVNEHYDDDRVEKSWRACVEKMKFSEQCQTLIKILHTETDIRLQEISAGLAKQIEFTGIKPEVPQLPAITGFFFNARTIPALQLTSSGIVEGVIGFFFDSKAKKIAKQKNKIRSVVLRSSNEIVHILEDQLVKTINRSVLRRQIKGFRIVLVNLMESMFRLAFDQKCAADLINDQFKELTFNLIVEALNHVGNPNDLEEIVTARSVGEELLLFSTDELSDEIKKRAEELLDEKITALRVSGDNYWDDVKTRSEKELLREEFYYLKFLERIYGKMQVIVLPPKFKDTSRAQLMQQLFDSPAFYY